LFLLFSYCDDREKCCELAALGRQPRAHLQIGGREGWGEGGRVMRCLQISSSGGAAQGMFLINFLDVMIVILSPSMPTSDDVAILLVTQKGCLIYRQSNKRQPHFCRQNGTSSNVILRKLWNIRATCGGFAHWPSWKPARWLTRRAASGSNSVPQVPSDSFKSSASL
jgi:hypothetical protein